MRRRQPKKQELAMPGERIHRFGLTLPPKVIRMAGGKVAGP